MGGTCAATIYSMTTEQYYLNLKGKRTVYPVWVYPSVDITDLSYLPRSGDDGSHGSFTGISNPAEQLKQAGYNWTYWETAEDLEKITDEVSQDAGVKQVEPVKDDTINNTQNQDGILTFIYSLFTEI